MRRISIKYYPMYAKVRMRRGLLALLLAVFVCPVALFAQLPEQMLNAPLPTDPKVKIGKLGVLHTPQCGRHHGE